MGKVRVRTDTGRLFLDFYFQGMRCREQTALTDSAANRRKVEKLMERIEFQIRTGKFDYASTFPGSPRAAQFTRDEETDRVVRVPGNGASRPEVRQTDRSPRFRDFAETWFREMEPQWRPTYQETVRGALNKHILPSFGNRRVGSIRRADLLEFRAALSKQLRPNGKRLGNARINKVMSFLRQTLNEAADRFEFPRPYQGIKSLKMNKADIRPFTLEEVNLILGRVRPDYRQYLAVRFFTGLRSGETNGLRWRNVDFSNNLIMVRETLVKGQIQKGAKTYESCRDIPMLPSVREAVEAQQELVPADTEWVFCNKRGKPIDNQNFTKRVWSPLLANLGLAYRRPYQTRHTAATLMLAAGEAPEWIARVLGHTTTEMLFKTYSRYVPNLTRQDGSAMAKLIAGVNFTNATQEDEE